MNKKEAYDVIVAGAGPAGMLAAGRAAELGGRVLLLEKMRREGRKLGITGKGRCNITNADPQEEFLSHIYPQGRFLKRAFGHFFSQDIIALLEVYGVEIQLERGGRYFPVNNQATEITKALMRWLSEKPVTLLRQTPAEKLLVEKQAVAGLKAGGRQYSAPSVVLATGGKAYPATGATGDGYALAKAAGHTIMPAKPALVPLEAAGSGAHKLEGLKLKNITAVVWVNKRKEAEAFGEMEFRDGSLAGAIILTLSRTVVEALQSGAEVELYLDLKPALEHKKLDNRLLRDLDKGGSKPLQEIFRGLLPGQMVPVFSEMTGLDMEKPASQVSAKERKRIRYYLKNFPFRILGHRPFKEALITAGGVPTREIASRTMASKLLPGLFFAGELIDLDADTGGYNLQIAWSTGWLAGESAMKRIAPDNAR